MEIIAVQNRDVSLKGKQLRAAGLVPGSVFGKTLPESIAIQLDEKTAQKLVRTCREGTKLQLQLNENKIPVQIKEKNYDTLKNAIVNLSFQALDPKQKVNSVIHLILKNAEKVSGTLERLQLEIPYAALPADMIDTITIDLEGMPAPTVMKAADVPELQNDRVELKIDPETIVFRINEKILLKE